MSLPPPLTLIVLAGASVGCSWIEAAEEEPDGEEADYPAGALTPVDCSDLPLASDEVVAGIERSEAVITPADLLRGEGQVAFELADDEGSQWYVSPVRDDAEIMFRDDGSLGPRWALRVKLACSPEAAAFVIFAREGGGAAPLSPGVFPLVGVGIDIPWSEQGSEIDAYDGSTVTLTYASDTRASGYMEGGGSGAIISHFTQEEVGLDCAIGAAAFRGVRLY